MGILQLGCGIGGIVLAVLFVWLVKQFCRVRHGWEDERGFHQGLKR